MKNEIKKLLEEHLEGFDVSRVIEILKNEDLLDQEWKLLNCSIGQGCNKWIYSNDYELIFFNIDKIDFADLQHCTSQYIINVCKEIGRDEVTRLYLDEVEQAEEDQAENK